MSTLIVPCPHCSQTTHLDAAQLPDQPVAYPCPQCGEQVVVDAQEMMQEQSSPTVAPAAPAPSAVLAAGGSTTPPDRRFGRLPEDATLPSGIILGEDEEVIGQVKQTLATLGSEVEPVSSADTAREIIINEQPDLCIYVGHTISMPPYAPMAPLTGLPPNFRRHLFLVLVSDNLKTLDGNAAFLFEVNMTLWKRDLEQLGAALYSGIDYHERLYRPYVEAVEASGSL